MVEQRFEIIVEAHEDTSVEEHLRERVSQIESIAGVVGVHVERTDVSDRDISEIHRILGDLSDHEFEQLEDAIDSYTEDTE